MDKKSEVATSGTSASEPAGDSEALADLELTLGTLAPGPSGGIETLQDLERAMRNHDWYYQFSDDHRVWRAGTDHAVEIRNAMARLSARGFADEVNAIFQRECPWSESNTKKDT